MLGWREYREEEEAENTNLVVTGTKSRGRWLSEENKITVAERREEESVDEVEMETELGETN